MAYSLRYLIACVLIAVAARAAEMAVSFTVFAPRTITDVAFEPRIGVPAQKLVFQPTARSVRYDYRGPAPLRFTDGSGAVVAEAAIPPEIREPLLLFSPIEPAPVAGVRYRIAILDDSVNRHGASGLVILNFSGLSLTGMIADQPVALLEGLNPVVSIGRGAAIELRTAFKGKSYRAYADRLRLGANERALLVLFPPFQKGGLEVQPRLLIDNPLAPKKSAAPARK
jgi:hypothetical protein